MNINKELAEVMNTAEKPTYENGEAPCNAVRYNNIDYRDPAIFAECVKFLLDSNYVIGKDVEGYFIQLNIDVDKFGYLLDDKDLFKAVALARIEAGKQ